MPNITFGRWNPTEVLERRLDNDWPSPTPYATNLVTPTSISSTGTGNSSSINANGSVTFSSCATLSLNGVFTSEYDNYMIVMRGTQSVLWAPRFRLRASGSDNSTASSYTQQYVFADAASVTSSRSPSDMASAAWMGPTNMAGVTISMYGAFLAQPTAWRVVSVSNEDSAAIVDYAGTHNQSTSYDGFSFLTESGYTITGLVSVYGLGV